MIKRVNKLEELEKKIMTCQNTDIENIDIENITDIKNIKIDRNKTSIERILAFLRSTSNPYVIKVNGTIVKMEFTNNSKLNASTCINNAMKNLYLNNC